MKQIHHHHTQKTFKNKLGCIGLVILIIAVALLLLAVASDGHLNWLKNLSH